MCPSRARTKSFKSFLIVMVIALLTGQSRGIVPLAEPPIPQRVALADLVVVGKVTALEPDLVDATPLLKIPRVGKIPYQIAVVSVQTPILGLKTPGSCVSDMSSCRPPPRKVRSNIDDWRASSWPWIKKVVSS